MRTQRLLSFKSAAARTRGIRKLGKLGYNYFVIYQDTKLKFALQYAKSKSKWVKARAVKGICLSGE